MRRRDDDTSWMDTAPCRGLTHLFYPATVDGRLLENDRTAAAAKEICCGCPHRQRCRDYAIRWSEPCGIWGGATTKERLGATKKRRRAVVVS